MFKCQKTAYSVKNNLIELYLSKAQSFDNAKNILTIGTVHGDEPQGADILKIFIKENITSKNNMFIIPCLNPDGYAQKTRTNANGVDLNRNFPTSNWEKTEKNEFYGGDAAESEPETMFLAKIVNEISPDLILTIHAPFKIVNYDGDALSYSKEIAKIIAYPIQHDIGYPTPGSFGTYCGIEKNIPTITLELGEDESNEFQKEKVFKILEYLCNC